MRQQKWSLCVVVVCGVWGFWWGGGDGIVEDTRSRWQPLFSKIDVLARSYIKSMSSSYDQQPPNPYVQHHANAYGQPVPYGQQQPPAYGQSQQYGEPPLVQGHIIQQPQPA